MFRFVTSKNADDARATARCVNYAAQTDLASNPVFSRVGG